MSARSVCRGKRPCRYHSDRAISLPFNRPDTRTLMPLQPKRSAESTAMRTTRRNPERFSSFSAMLSATSCASSSGLFTSTMSMVTSRLVRSWISAFSLSISAPKHDARRRGADDEPQLLSRPLDFHRAHAGQLQLLLQLTLQLNVFDQELVVVANHKPPRPPRLFHTQPQSIRMDFLSHTLPFLARLRGLGSFGGGLLRRRLLCGIFGRGRLLRSRFD